MLNLKKFTQVGVSFDAKISVRPNGMMGVSSGALRRFGLLEGDWYVVMYYDEGEKVMGIEPTRDEEADGAIKLVVRQPRAGSLQKQPSGHFSAKSFLQHHAIPFRGKRAQSFEAEWSDEHSMILIDLKKPKNGPKDGTQNETSSEAEEIEENSRQTPEASDGENHPF